MMKRQKSGLRRGFAVTMALLLVFALAVPCMAETVSSESSAAQETFLLQAPSGVAAAKDGTLLVTDTAQHCIFTYAPATGAISRFAGVTAGQDLWGDSLGGYKDGAAAEAFFNAPYDIEPFLDGYVISDSGNNVIRYIADGTVKTLAGTGTAGSADGNAAKATFRMPKGLAADSSGNLYIADCGNNCIRKINEKGSVSTIIKGLHEPSGVCWDNGTLYIADTGSHRILSWSDGALQVLAGSSDFVSADNVYGGGFADGKGDNALFDSPADIEAENGIVYVSDRSNGAIRCIADGQVSTLLAHGFSGNDVWPGEPVGLLISNGTLYAADSFCGMILTVSLKTLDFSDVADQAWYADTVRTLCTTGLVNGTAADRFSPNAVMNRAMLVTILHRYKQGQDYNVVLPAGAQSFADVAADSWYADAVSWAADSGIVKGYGKSFGAMNAISRQDLAVILYRYAASEGSAVSGSAALTAYTDNGAVAAYAADAVRWAVADSILGGYEDNTLRPAAGVTRAEACTMLARALAL